MGGGGGLGPRSRSVVYFLCKSLINSGIDLLNATVARGVSCLSYILRMKNTSSRLMDTLFTTVDRVCGVQSHFCHWYEMNMLSHM